MKNANAIALTLTSIAIVLALQVSSSSANPFDLYPWDPHTKVSIISPSENTKLSNNAFTLTFNVDLSLWYTDVVSRRNPVYKCYVWSIKYYLDGKLEGNIFGSLENDISGKHSIQLNAIEGKHNLRVEVSTAGKHWQRGAINNSWSTSNAVVEDSSQVVYFTIDVHPIISSISMENKTYYGSQIPLTFNIAATFFQMGYSLDNSSSVAIAGNTTLSIPQGSHNIVLYAKDATGNTWKSDKIFFTVFTPAPSLVPSPKLSPSPAATQQATPEQTQTPISKSDNLDFAVLSIMGGISTLVAYIVGTIVYLKERRRLFNKAITET